MKNELLKLKPGDVIEISNPKDKKEKYICIIADIDGAYRLISSDGYDFMIDEDGRDFTGYTREDLEKYLSNRDWDVIKYYRGLEEFLILNRPPKMTREKMIEALKEIGNITLDSKKIQNVMPEIYEYFVHVFRFMEENLKDFQKGKYLVNICFLPDRVTYTIGKDVQQLTNEPHWIEDRWEYIETEELATLLEFAK